MARANLNSSNLSTERTGYRARMAAMLGITGAAGAQALVFSDSEDDQDAHGDDADNADYGLSSDLGPTSVAEPSAAAGDVAVAEMTGSDAGGDGARPASGDAAGVCGEGANDDNEDDRNTVSGFESAESELTTPPGPAASSSPPPRSASSTTDQAEAPPHLKAGASAPHAVPSAHLRHRRRRRTSPAHKRMRKDGVRKPRRWRQGTVALREIRRMQTTTDLQIRRLPFQRLVRDIIDDIAPGRGFRVCAKAFAALQESAEAFLVNRFNRGQLAAIHARRVTLFPRDLTLADTYTQ